MGKKISVVLLLILFHVNIVHADNNAIKGLKVGAGVGAAFGGIIGIAWSSSDDFTGDTGSAILFPALLFGAIGGIVGASIGAAIPKKHNYSIVPMYSQSKEFGTTTGGSVQVNF